MNTQKELYKKLTQSVSDWRFEANHATHIPTRTTFWMSSGLMGFDEYECLPTGFSFVYKIHLYRWLKKARRIDLIRKCSIR